MFHTKNLIFTTTLLAGTIATAPLQAMDKAMTTRTQAVKYTYFSKYLVLAPYIFESLNQDVSKHILGLLNSLLEQAIVKFRISKWNNKNTPPFPNNPSEALLSLIIKTRGSHTIDLTTHLLSLTEITSLRDAFLKAFQLGDFDNGLIILAAAQIISQALKDNSNTWRLLDHSNEIAPNITLTALDFALYALDTKSVFTLLQAAKPNAHALIRRSSIATLFLASGQDHAEIWSLLQEALRSENYNPVPITSSELENEDEEKHEDNNHADQKLLKRLRKIKKRLRALTLGIPGLRHS